MAESSLAFTENVIDKSQNEIKEQTYLQAVTAKLLRDKITVAATFLLAFMIAITLTAPWISENVLGFDPTFVELDKKVDPPTWASKSWPMFENFTRTCRRSSCDWSMWGAIVSSSFSGIGQCLNSGPGQCNWLGTDDLGRDVLTRALYGGRISLRIGTYVAGVTITFGVVMGLISGYYAATYVDDAINAVIQTINSIPTLFLLIILLATFPALRSPEGLSFILGVLSWTGISRLIRGQIFSIRERDYILASRAVGASIWRIMFRHMLPNVASIIIVAAVFIVAGAILTEAGLSFLGVGIGPPNPSWGNMMNSSRSSFFIKAPWLMLTPGIFIFLTTLPIYLIGDGLRDALDPWVKNE